MRRRVRWVSFTFWVFDLVGGWVEMRAAQLISTRLRQAQRAITRRRRLPLNTMFTPGIYVLRCKLTASGPVTQPFRLTVLIVRDLPSSGNEKVSILQNT